MNRYIAGFMLAAALTITGCASVPPPPQNVPGPSRVTDPSPAKSGPNLTVPNDEAVIQTAFAFVTAVVQHDVPNMKRLVRQDLVNTAEATFDWRDKNTGLSPKLIGSPEFVSIMTQNTGPAGYIQPIVDVQIEESAGKRRVRVGVAMEKQGDSWRVVDLNVLP